MTIINLYINKTMNTILVFIICMLVAFAPGLVGVAAMGDQQRAKWYLDNKPKYTPPAIVFPIVWNILYFMIGLALFFVVQKMPKGKKFNTVLALFGANLILNAMWTPIFFKYQMFKLAYAVIVVMIVLTVVLIVNKKVPLRSRALLVPYALWLTFASFLNLHFTRV